MVQSLGNAEATSKKRLNIGFLWAKNNFQNIAFSAFEIGVKHVKYEVASFDIHYNMEDSYCNAKIGMKAVLRLKQKYHQLDGIFGPQCSVACEPVGLYTAALNIPQISARCTSNKLSDKKIYPTFTSARGYSKSWTVIVLSLLQKLGWNALSIVTNDAPVFKLEAKRQQKLCEEHGMNVQLYTISSTVRGDKVDKKKLDTLRRLLLGMKEKSRVTLMYMYDKDIRNLLILAKYEELLNKDHVFIGFNPTYRGTMAEVKYIEPHLTDALVYDGVIAITGDHATDTARWNEFMNEMALALSMKNYTQDEIEMTLKKTGPYSGEIKHLDLREQVSIR